RRLEPGQDHSADHPAPRAEPRRAAPRPARFAAEESGRRMTPAPDPKNVVEQKPLLPWTLAFLRPYRSKVALLALLLGSEVVLGALQPWPLAIVIDYVRSEERRVGKECGSRG